MIKNRRSFRNNKMVWLKYDPIKKNKSTGFLVLLFQARLLSLLLSLSLSLIFSGACYAGEKEKVEKGIEAYQNEQWDEALNQFQDALLDDPENPQLHYNLGSALYKKEKYQEALNSFEKALMTENLELQQSAYYNRGNTLYQLQKYPESIDAYKKALDINPNDEDAKHNLELVRAKIKEMSDKQKQQQDQQKDKVEPSEYAKQLKAQAEILVSQRFYKEAYKLMKQGELSDPTVAAFGAFTERIKTIVDIEEST